MPGLLPSVPSLLVLQVLADGPAHGYEIARSIERDSGGVLTMKEGTLYPLLYKLERDGLVCARWREGADGRRLRVYALTRPGRGRLADDRHQWAVRAASVSRALGLREGTALGPA